MMIRTTRIAAGVRKDRVFSELTSPKKPVKVNPEEAKLASLTQKKPQVIRVVVEGSGAPSKTLASRLFVTEHTFRNYLTASYQKLSAADRLVYLCDQAPAGRGAALN